MESFREIDRAEMLQVEGGGLKSWFKNNWQKVLAVGAIVVATIVTGHGPTPNPHWPN